MRVEKAVWWNGSYYRSRAACEDALEFRPCFKTEGRFSNLVGTRSCRRRGESMPPAAKRKGLGPFFTLFLRRSAHTLSTEASERGWGSGEGDASRFHA